MSSQNFNLNVIKQNLASVFEKQIEHIRKAHSEEIKKKAEEYEKRIAQKNAELDMERKRSRVMEQTFQQARNDLVSLYTVNSFSHPFSGKSII